MSLPGESLDYRISSISPAVALRPFPRTLLRASIDPPLSSRHVVCVSFAFFLFLSLTTLTEYYRSLLSALHFADPSGPRTNTEYPLAYVLRVEGRSFFFSAKH